jgi:hypothetical protein
MPRKDKRNVQQPSQLSASQTCVGVMPMDDIGQAIAPIVGQGLVDEHFDVGPKGFLLEIAPGTKRNTYDSGILCNRFFDLGVVGRNFWINDLPCQ